MMNKYTCTVKHWTSMKYTLCGSDVCYIHVNISRWNDIDIQTSLAVAFVEYTFLWKINNPYILKFNHMGHEQTVNSVHWIGCCAYIAEFKRISVLCGFIYVHYTSCIHTMLTYGPQITTAMKYWNRHLDWRHFLDYIGICRVEMDLLFLWFSSHTHT